MTEDPKTTTNDALTETAERNDEIIGVAFKWSALVIVLAAAVVLAIVFWPEANDEGNGVIDKGDPDIDDNTTDVSATPRIPFTDITASSGVTFVHNNGAVGDKLLPETMGGGVALFDYDNDNDPDLLLVNAMNWAWDQDHEERAHATTALYQNNGDGTFTDVTIQAGLGIESYGMGCAIGDVDNDGWIDVFLTAVGQNRLLRNNQGVFVDITTSAGVGGEQDGWSSSTGFFDMENDGDLDLFVCNYVQWSRDIDYEVDFQIAGLGRAYGPPKNFAGSYCTLYRNNDDGTFTDVTESAGIAVRNPVTDVAAAKALAVTFIDLDGDGLLEIVVANDTTPNFLFHNLGSGTFEDIGATSGVAFDRNGNATGAMGVDATHPRNDNAIGISIGNFAREETSFFISQHDALTFEDMTSLEGIGAASRARLSFGLLFLDLDLDGWDDLLQANGHLEEDIAVIEKSQHYEQPVQVFWNNGLDARRCYSMLEDDALGDLATPVVGRGATCADLDGDGDLDVVISQPGRAPAIYRNDQTMNHNWLRLKLNGAEGNRNAIGAVVQVTCNDTVMIKTVMPTRSYLSQTELPLTFGLGDDEDVTEVRITWPSGNVQIINDIDVNAMTVIDELVSE